MPKKGIGPPRRNNWESFIPTAKCPVCRYSPGPTLLHRRQMLGVGEELGFDTFQVESLQKELKQAQTNQKIVLMSVKGNSVTSGAALILP